MIEILSDEKSLGYVDQQRYVDPRRVTKEFYIASANIKTDNFHVFIYVMRNNTLKAYLSKDPLIIPPEGIASFDYDYDAHISIQSCVFDLKFAKQVELSTNEDNLITKPASSVKMVSVPFYNPIRLTMVEKDKCVKKIPLVDRIAEHSYKQHIAGTNSDLTIRMSTEDVINAFSISTITYTFNEY